MRRAVFVSLLLVALTQMPARAAVDTVFAGPGSYAATYTTPVVVVRGGSSVQFVNADAQAHNVQALDATRPDDTAPWCSGFPRGGCPLFWSDEIGIAETTPVLGLEDAASGSQLTFVCAPHPWMTGTLIVQ
ncbi:MAG TPA: plastocyanin/azurin family copper-binding protein [Actinomycetota bacterium]|nr:plastocyanin/azurin family copper-binding protein [Actinomycetota bacterium]